MHPGSIPGEASTAPPTSPFCPRTARNGFEPPSRLSNAVAPLEEHSGCRCVGRCRRAHPLRRGGKKRHRSPLPPPGSGVCRLGVPVWIKNHPNWNKEGGGAFVAIAGPRHPLCAVLRGCSQPGLYSETEQLAAGTYPPHFSLRADPRSAPFGTIPVCGHSSPEPAKEKTMNQLIYLVGLVVVVIAILSFFGFA